MENISIENGNYLKIKIDGNMELPKIIFSNSLGTDNRLWNPQIEALKDKFCLIRYDTRGHGNSSSVKGPYSLKCLKMTLLLY